MTLRASKPTFNVREKLTELGRRFGLKGSELAAAETVQEARDLVSAGRKNLVINGSMMINQRGNKTGYVGSSNEVYHGPDRFLTSIYGTVSINQSSDVPEGYGFEYSKELLCAATSTHANRYLTFIYRMEGYDSMVFNYGTSKAKHVTLSFWIKSNKACDISVNFENEQNADRGYQVKQTINNVGTWEKKIVTIPGDIARTLTTGPQKAFCFDIFLSAPGSNFTGGTPSESWTDLNNNQRGVHCNADFYDSTSNYFRVTGVQLELGKNATEFEHRSYGEELALCQRYFMTFPSRNGGALQWIVSYLNGTVRAVCLVPNSMRQLPTAKEKDGTTTISSGNVYSTNGTNVSSQTSEGNNPTFQVTGSAASPVVMMVWTSASAPTTFSNNYASASWNGALPGVFLDAEL